MMSCTTRDGVSQIASPRTASTTRGASSADRTACADASSESYMMPAAASFLCSCPSRTVSPTDSSPDRAALHRCRMRACRSGGDFAASPRTTPIISTPELDRVQFCVSVHTVSVALEPSAACGLDVIGMITPGEPSRRVTPPAPMCSEYSERISGVTRDGMFPIVVRVCSWLTARRRIHGSRSGRPCHVSPPSSVAGTDGPRRAMSARTAASGSLPQPLHRWSTTVGVRNCPSAPTA